jgi:hypothetical protein
VSSYDWLLFLHVLFGVALVTGVVCLTPYAMGRGDTPVVNRLLKVGGILAASGGLGALLLGFALIANRDYKFFSFWIVGSLLLWLVGVATGERVARVERPRAARLHVISAIAVFCLLILMIFKPGV